MLVSRLFNSSAWVLTLSVWLTPYSFGQDNPFKKEPSKPEAPKRESGRRQPVRREPTPRPTLPQPTPAPQPSTALTPFVNLVGIEMIPVRYGGRDMYFSKYEVTQEQWQAVMGNNPSFHKGSDLPVSKVSFEDVAKFIETLNQLERGKPLRYRLPTVEEWDAAARGNGALNLEAEGWYNRNSGGRPQPVGRKRPNAFGLYDMAGNVWEWCAGSFVRGGAYDSPSERCGAGMGYKEAPQGRDSNIGFRVVATPIGQ
ncbi:MAG: formylglycine-generating enzyme family protein [Chloracidobacterium sp.]|uniref:SUMF1/EgtB/PvdO family nonheme iron enzyme n=1 Tax=Chloracidobacterium validum TaxID=2821543 RepID=A0ABX8B7N1_9BACT|nr:formylglycine-generating enzyme family protein [Chloracidobacterium validum]QUW02689.1 SUMF1/EgtB/PvdO family nonheme iron enzyme [Chloracidobacterium validum]